MAIPRVGKANRENVKELQKRLLKDPSLRDEAIRRIKRSLPKFVEDTFELTPWERGQFRRIMRKGVSEAAGRAWVAALETGGDINCEIVRGAAKPGIKIEWAYEEESGIPDDININVNIEC